MPKIPDAILNKLRCANCKFWISCGPVRVLENGGSVCGRCPLYAPVDQYRHFAYEALACYFKFPCKYWDNHCQDGLSFKEVIAHENECSYTPGCWFCCCHPFIACKSRRKLDINAAIHLEIVPEQILEYLRCSICAGYLSSTPVLVAKDGTSTCHRCSIQYSLVKKQEHRRHILFEAFIDMMIFPCVFRYEGCTKLSKFGESMHLHETDCPYNANTHRQKQQHTQTRQTGQKERGVIETLSGHIYGTITPSAALFALTTGKQLEKEMFLDEFQKHKEILASKWSFRQEEKVTQKVEPAAKLLGVNRSFINSSFSRADVISKPPLSRTQSINRPDDFRNSLIDELKQKQILKSNSFRNSARLDDYQGAGPSTSSSNSSERASSPRRLEYNVYP